MSVSHDEISARVSLEIFRAQGGSGEPPPQSAQKRLAELALDSLKVIEIVYQLETFYQLDVDEEQLAELEKIGDLIEMFVKAMAIKEGISSKD